MHAFFKSLLFLASGAIIHAVFDQDIRRMGGLVLLTPITYCVFFLGSLSLVAFPFTSGFYSKDFLLEILLVPLNITHTIAYLFTLLAAFLTSTYSIRLLMIAMYSRPNFPLTLLPFVKDSPLLMTAPLLFLSFWAVCIGYLTHELFLGFGSTFYGQSLFTLPEHLRLFDASYASLSTYSSLAFLPLMFLTLFYFALPFVSTSHSSISTPISIPQSSRLNAAPGFGSSRFVPNSWRNSTVFDPSLLTYSNVFNYWIMHSVLSLSVFIYRYWDKGLIEFLGPIGLFRSLHWFGFKVESLATGFIPHQGFIVLAIILSFALSPIISLLLLLLNLYFFLFLSF